MSKNLLTQHFKDKKQTKQKIHNFIDHESTQVSQMVAIPGHFTIVLCLYTFLSDSGCACVSSDTAEAIVESWWWQWKEELI